MPNQPDAELIEFLTAALQAAQSGELKGAALVGCCAGGGVWCGIAGEWPDTLHALGALSELSHQINYAQHNLSDSNDLKTY